MRARSVWRIESLRFRVALFMAVGAVGSPELAARSSIASIYHHFINTFLIKNNAAQRILN